MAESYAHSRFAVYLIPPYEVSRAVDEVHRLLRKQFGYVAADQFQVHATIKGFFKKTPGPLEPLIKRLDAVFAEQEPFPVQVQGLRINDIGFGLNVSSIGEDLNPAMMDLRECVVDVVRPYIAPDCDFVEKDLGDPFRAHITLAFRDIPLDMQEQVLDYLSDAPLPTGSFNARFFHLLEFFCDDWEGDWAATLTWKLHKSWRLGMTDER